jgi:hypothetical protein
MYLRRNEQWTAIRSEAEEFKTVVEAIMVCIHCRARDVRLVGQNEAGVEVYLYPFGGDPVVRRELKQMRRNIRDARRLRAERRVVRARIDSLMAVRKEMKKQFPFEQKRVAASH